MKKNNIESQPSQVLRSDNVTISSRKGCFLITASALLELWISCTAYSSWSTLSYSTIFLVKKKKALQQANDCVRNYLLSEALVFTCKNYTLFWKTHLFTENKNNFFDLLGVHIWCHVLLMKRTFPLNSHSGYARNVVAYSAPHITAKIASDVSKCKITILY